MSRAPLSLCPAARPWISRRRGECAFPVDGEGAALRCCCRPCRPATYCPAHAERMRGPPAPDGEQLFCALEPLLERLLERD